MARAEEPIQMQVIDSDGVKGHLVSPPTQAGAGADDLALIRFDGGRTIQVPLAILRRRTDGMFELPLSLRALVADQADVERSGGGQTGRDGSQVVAVIPVIAEEGHVSTREVETGRVRIHKSVHTEQKQIDVPLVEETVQVERVAVDRFVEAPLEPHYAGETLVIPVMEEVLVVSKRLRVREEIHVTRVRQERRQTETVTLQREQVEIARDDGDRPGAAVPSAPTRER